VSNLSDLLPAGAAAKQLTFTDSGSGISSKAPVVLNSDGTVSPITIGSDSAGTPVYFSGSSDSKTQGGMASNGSGEILYAYRANNGYGTVQVVNYATPGGSITYGTPVTFLSSSTGGLSCAYDTQSGYYVIAYTNSGSNFVGECRCVSVSGTTPTVYSASSLSSYPYQVNNTDLEYDPTQQMTFLAYDYVYDDGSSSFYAGAYVRLVQPSSAYNPPTLHGAQDAEGTGSSSFMGRASMVYDPSVSKTVIHFVNILGSAFSKIMSVSGTTISFSANTAFNSGTTYNPFATYDSNQNAQVVAFRDSSNKGYVIAGTTGASSITYGSEVEFSDGNQVHSDSNAFGVAYDANAQKVVIVYADDGDSDNGKVVFATVSGTAVTVTTPIYLDGSSGTPVRMFASVYDATGKRVIVSYTLNSNDSTKNNAVEPGATNLTTANFVGVADSAISASAAGSVIVQGGTVSGITDPFGTVSLTLASPDTTSGNTTKEDVSMAYDSNADRTILVYRDGGDSDKLKCIIGTLSGTSTSWGTPVEIVGATAGNRGTAVVYDSNAQRVLIAYTKASDNYAYVRVGEISGTSVTLGTEVAASSSNSYYPELSYDVADQKVLLVFANAGDNYYPYSAACTITAVGNSVAVTTPASVASRNAYDPFGLAYNANDGKHVLDITDNTSTGYAYVLTMSSGSVSVGAETSYSPGFTPRQSFCVYDSSAQKIVRGYYSNTDPRPVEFAVASISGTSVSFGTAATCFAGNGGRQVSGTFDSSANQVAFFNLPFATTSLETNFGTVSGTTITFGTATTVASSGVISGSFFDMTYDSTAQKLIYAYRATTFDAAVGTLGATTFTTGTKYYVTSTGGFSSSADSPSVNAGLAISTTSLLLNGDS
tara:strand:- start:1072 stop:3705 length:2634 start_codon:yes stop_codon:yes gene_type:complete